MLSKKKAYTILLLLIGLHSTILGVFIYFFTDIFYQIFFDTAITNIFYVKQSGLFLFLIGLFYLTPLYEINKKSYSTLLIIFSKICAVLFLFINANSTPSPSIINLVALGDLSMAIVLSISYWLYIKEK